jgi:hypothetical protein
MTPTELRRIGGALWGPRWQTPMAVGLGVSARTVRRWASGDWTTPNDKAVILRALADAITRAPAPDETAPSDWTVSGNTARHASGVTVKFIRDPDGGWSGKLVAGLEIVNLNPTRAARLMREAGDVWGAGRQATARI